MRTIIHPKSIILGVVTMLLAGGSVVACHREKSAADTIQPVKQYFEKQADANLSGPNLTEIEGNKGMILTWKTSGNETERPVEYSWVLAKNTPEMMKALIMFDSARAWNTETYIFLPVTQAALDVHQKVGLTVPKAIYDEDGMNRIREIVVSGKTPKGGFVEQFSQFAE